MVLLQSPPLPSFCLCLIFLPVSKVQPTIKASSWANSTTPVGSSFNTKRQKKKEILKSDTFETGFRYVTVSWRQCRPVFQSFACIMTDGLLSCVLLLACAVSSAASLSLEPQLLFFFISLCNNWSDAAVALSLSLSFSLLHLKPSMLLTGFYGTFVASENTDPTFK